MLKKVAIKTLANAKWNPGSRIKNIKPLVASIVRVGLLYPVLITKDNKIIDGHRRIAAAKSLGWEEIPVIVVAGNQAEMFAEVNSQKKSLTGNQTLQVYLTEPAAVGARARVHLTELEETCGRAMVERMARDGFSLATWNMATRIAQDAEQEGMVGKILRWLMKYRCAHLVHRAMQAGTAPSKLIAAVKNDKPIRVSYVQ